MGPGSALRLSGVTVVEDGTRTHTLAPNTAVIPDLIGDPLVAEAFEKGSAFAEASRTLAYRVA